MIVGRRTYELMQESGELTTLELRNLIVVSSKFDNTSHHVAHSPEQAIAYLAALGEKEVLICGGASIATHLLQRGLLNEIIIDTVSTLIS
jgi:dihydrofolate reductase